MGWGGVCQIIPISVFWESRMFNVELSTTGLKNRSNLPYIANEQKTCYVLLLYFQLLSPISYAITPNPTIPPITPIPPNLSRKFNFSMKIWLKHTHTNTHTHTHTHTQKLILWNHEKRHNTLCKWDRGILCPFLEFVYLSFFETRLCLKIPC